MRRTPQQVRADALEALALMAVFLGFLALLAYAYRDPSRVAARCSTDSECAALPDCRADPTCDGGPAPAR
jgi:hypothetical protein